MNRSTVVSHRHGKHLRTRLHGFAHRLAAELHHRLDQVAVAFLNNAFFLARFDQRIHGLGCALRFLARIFAGERCHRLQETQNDRHRQHQIDQDSSEAMSSG